MILLRKSTKKRCPTKLHRKFCFRRTGTEVTGCISEILWGTCVGMVKHIEKKNFNACQHMEQRIYVQIDQRCPKAH